MSIQIFCLAICSIVCTFCPPRNNALDLTLRGVTMATSQPAAASDPSEQQPQASATRYSGVRGLMNLYRDRQDALARQSLEVSDPAVQSRDVSAARSSSAQPRRPAVTPQPARQSTHASSVQTTSTAHTGNATASLRSAANANRSASATPASRHPASSPASHIRASVPAPSYSSQQTPALGMLIRESGLIGVSYIKDTLPKFFTESKAAIIVVIINLANLLDADSTDTLIYKVSSALDSYQLDENVLPHKKLTSAQRQLLLFQLEALFTEY